MSLHRHSVMSPKEFPSQPRIQKIFLLAEKSACHLSIPTQPEGRIRAKNKTKQNTETKPLLSHAQTQDARCKQKTRRERCTSELCPHHLSSWVLRQERGAARHPVSLPGRNATWHLPMCSPILTEHNVDVPPAAMGRLETLQ